jgi:hypothetical protein
MQQNTVTLILASFIGLLLSGYWMFHEVRFVSTMNEFDQDISWLLQAPLMLFISVLILISLMLFIGSIGQFSFIELKKEVAWKKLFTTILAFNAIVFLFAWLNTYFQLSNNLITQIFMIVLLVVFYIYASVKQKINPIFFLLCLCAVSSVLLYIFLGVDW